MYYYYYIWSQLLYLYLDVIFQICNRIVSVYFLGLFQLTINSNVNEIPTLLVK